MQAVVVVVAGVEVSEDHDVTVICVMSRGRMKDFVIATRWAGCLEKLTS